MYSIQSLQFTQTVYCLVICDVKPKVRVNLDYVQHGASMDYS